MKIKLLCLLSLMLLAAGAMGQTQSTGSISANGVCLPFRTQNNSTVGIIVSGTWTGTLTPNVQIVTTSGAPTVAKKVLPVDGSAAQATITANGGFLANVAGFTQFNVCSTAWTSGTAVVTVYSTPAPNNSTIAAGSGGLPTGLAFASPEFDISSAGNGSGILGLAGNTSGIAKFTGPAVAGTVANPVIMTNSLQWPSQGFIYYNVALNIVSGGVGGTNNAVFENGYFAGSNVFTFGWLPGNVLTASMDTGFSRPAAAVIAAGNGTVNDESALVRAGNVCRITADINLTVNVASNACSFSLPAVAKAWAFSCDILWAITAGSGTNNFAVGVNASQTPTGTTNVSGKVNTATSTFTEGPAVALSASGALNVLTGATYTPAASIWPARITGTLLASATAGTFAITGTANGTTATAAIKSGSQCELR